LLDGWGKLFSKKRKRFKVEDLIFSLLSRRIKKKKIYVISTLKRPVPLEYFLYTGNSAKTAEEMFPIVDSRGRFLPDGHKRAVDAKKQRSKSSRDNYGAKGARQNTNPNEASYCLQHPFSH
jgi:antiviral helicase SKI2